MSDRDDRLSDYFLEPEMMIKLYCTGAFPMANDKDSDAVEWYMPELRTIIPLDAFNIPRSLNKVIKENKFTVFYDRDFNAVVQGCAAREETWISPKLIDAYLRIHKLGYIHTVEVYEGEELAGGLYGVTVGGVFFGESMFSYKSQASKTALYYLIMRLLERGFSVLDVQLMNEHLRMFGAVEIPDQQYKELLAEGLQRKCKFS